ncbi:MAG: SapC family protein [Woeseia sp.]|nr:SapC family protein [Woeseia sp.]MBT8096365.1 SapC family protein [Woeseia sp.]NNE61455.1 SapC family protein [Woeseia sp.]
MANHVLLDNVSHKDLKVHKIYEKGAGFDVNLARAFPVEFSRLQREYPLFFIKNAESGEFESIALLGFGQAENLYLTTDRWDAAYLPLTIERQPFLIGFQETTEDGIPTQVPVVHIDLDDPSISYTEGERVFLEHGGESPFLERMMSILMAIHEGHDASQSFSRLLVGLELIESVALEIKFKDGTTQNLAGLYTINEDKLRKLSANGLEVLHTQGHLHTVFMMLASLQNMPDLIERKNKRLAP